jgi:hypothetical protein
VKNSSLLDEFAGDPAMAEVREHTGWKPVVATLLALAFCVSIFFNQPDPQPAQVVMQSTAQPEAVAP